METEHKSGDSGFTGLACMPRMKKVRIRAPPKEGKRKIQICMYVYTDSKMLNVPHTRGVAISTHRPRKFNKKQKQKCEVFAIFLCENQR